MNKIERSGNGLGFRNSFWKASFEAGALNAAGIIVEPQIVLVEGGMETALSAPDLKVVIDDAVLARVVASGTSPEGHRLRITYDVYQTPNLHVYLRLTWGRNVALDAVEFPRLRAERFNSLVTKGISATLDSAVTIRLAEPWFQLRGNGGVLGVGLTKRPWAARWNDVGATAYYTVANARLRLIPGAGVGLWCAGRFEAAADDTLEMALFLRPMDESPESLAREATHDDPRELRYIPLSEWEQFQSRQVEDRWLGPPIQGGCPNRPLDQLIPRSLGMDILARRRFSWNNEDLSLWRITGKAIYRDIGIKKAYGLLAAQNEHGGWFEGIEFYNLPPRHHQHYHSYTAFVYLIDAYDVTGHRPFLDAALRSKDFWFGPPPANSHSVDAEDAWWYRWGGYINEAGYTDERHALNTHASVLMIFSLLWTRVHDEQARRGLLNGVNAFKRGLDQGLQRSNGQFLYSLSQIDPRYERPGDPPYIQTNLIPEIEDVYTVLSAFRLLVANRVAADPVVCESCARALNYWWRAQDEGRAYTYRSYAVKTFGIAAGEMDLRYAFCLPRLLADPDNWTAIYRGFSAWVAPWRHKALLVTVEGDPPGMESVFLSRDAAAFRFAVVNTAMPCSKIPVTVELDEATAGARVELLDPAGGRLVAALPSAERDGRLEFEIPRLSESSVAVVRLVSAAQGGAA
jgi:hypothetical protein